MSQLNLDVWNKKQGDLNFSSINFDEKPYPTWRLKSIQESIQISDQILNGPIIWKSAAELSEIWMSNNQIPTNLAFENKFEIFARISIQ